MPTQLVPRRGAALPAAALPASAIAALRRAFDHQRDALAASPARPSAARLLALAGVASLLGEKVAERSLRAAAQQLQTERPPAAPGDAAPGGKGRRPA